MSIEYFSYQLTKGKYFTENIDEYKMQFYNLMTGAIFLRVCFTINNDKIQVVDILGIDHGISESSKQKLVSKFCIVSDILSTKKVLSDLFWNFNTLELEGIIPDEFGDRCRKCIVIPNPVESLIKKIIVDKDAYIRSNKLHKII